MANKVYRILTLLLFIWTPALLLGQNSNDAILKKTVLFKISKPYSNKTSYLFGTHHAFGKSFFDSLIIANKALASCNVMIKENLNIPGETAEDIINQRTATTKWERYANKKDLSFMKTLFATSATDFNKLTPAEMYAFLNRYFKQQVCLNDTDRFQSLDDYIASKAKQMNLELFGLETTEEQIALINKDIEGMPRKVHKKRLSNIIEKIESERTTDCEETEWYMNMAIDYQLKEPCRNALMLTDRNEKWMQTIPELLETNNCFIAVGLSHLMYECGLINELQGLGYTVEPVGLK